MSVDSDKTSVIKLWGAQPDLVVAALNKARSACADIDFSVDELYGDVKISIIFLSEEPEGFDVALRVLLSDLSDYVYAIKDVALSEVLFDLLKLHGSKLCVAESFTGGEICASLVKISGASSVLYEGIVAYSNAAKMDRLGVKAETLARYGAVSDQTAYEMCASLSSRYGCNTAIATTGIAGPLSDDTNKPVGLCYIAVGVDERITVYKYNFKGSREEITRTAVNAALFLTYKQIK